jgi:hypothetical protein
MSQFENQSWYPEWKEVVDRVVAARMAVDATAPETPERQAADREYQTALTDFRILAEKLRLRSEIDRQYQA